VSDKGWKQAERRMARDVGCERIPVTGERHGADFTDGLCVYQLKVRRAIPGWLWDWLTGIQSAGRRADKVGVLVLKRPRERDADAVVVLSWADWCALHGNAQSGQVPESPQAVDAVVTPDGVTTT
jgi:hypothetical protein